MFYKLYMFLTISIFLITFFNSITPVEAGTVALWRFEETSGSTASDSSANSNDGTLTNMSSPSCWVDGEIGGGLYFDGSDDYVNCGDDSSLDFGTGDFTVELWMKTSASAGEYQGLIGKIDTSTWTGWGLQMRTDGSVDVYLNGEHNYISGDYDLRDGEWHHVVAIRDGQEAILYIDGEYIGKITRTTNDDSVDTTTDLKIGKFYLGVESTLDEVQLYDEALDVDEVLTQYMRGIRPAYWKLDETSGTSAADSSGNDNDGTLTNMSAPSCWGEEHINPDGYFESVLEFDGVDDYVNCGNDSSIKFGAEDFSISLWLNTSASVGNYQGLIGKIDTSTWMGWGLQIITDGRLDFYLNHEHNYINGDYDLRDGLWHHIVAVRKGQDAMVYIDGEYINKVTRSTNDDSIATTVDLKIGKFYLGVACLIDEVELYKKALTADEISAMQFNLLSVYPERNYYTSETNAVAVCSLDIPSTELAGYYLTAKSGTTSLGTNTTPEDGTDLTYSISSLSNGSNTISVELRSDAGDLVFTQDMDVVKKASSSGVEVKIDQRNSTVLVDGTPFFPIGVTGWRITSSGTSDFQTLSNADFNTIIRWYNNAGISPTDATSYLQNADTYDLKVIDLHTAYTSESLFTYKDSEDFMDEYLEERTSIIDAVEYAKAEDNLLGYYTFDEPHATQIEAGQDLYSETNTEDGYHPTFLNYSSHIPPGDDYTNWCDSLAVDPYWYPPRVSGELRSSVDWVSKYVTRACDRAKDDLKALYIMPMSEFWSASNKRAILPSEQRLQTYLCIIHGAKGIIYWTYPIYHDDSWTMLSTLAGELTDLAPSMLTEDVEQTISYSEWDSQSSSYVPVTFDPSDEQFVDVQISLREAPSSASYDYVLLAANTSRYSVDVDFDISLLGSSGTVYRRVFDSSDTNQYTVSNGAFSDQIEGFGTRAYTFSSSSTDPVTIDVDFKIRTDLTATIAAEGTPEPISGRENCTNLMQNPDLEDYTLSSWPDYVYPYYSQRFVTSRINAANQDWGLVSNPDLSGLNSAIVNDGGTSGDAGSTCLTIVNSSSHDDAGLYFRLAPEHTVSAGKSYTFSAYIKGDQNGYKVKFGSDSGSGYFYPTTSWVRYSTTITIPMDVSEYHKFKVQLLDTGKIWIDAIQVEDASSASVFTTD